ncbi:RelA/SpoT domain-containing protein [Candidatus Micrarchaeota archaeon]|nr:RelA/SpoT domain-containing protein [Candidatus Micrarchaeota archaeon]
MNWTKPKGHSKEKVNSAGEILADEHNSLAEKDEAIEILSNWRACHSYPLHVFKIRLKRASKNVDKTSLTAQRLKRVPSIIKKLKRRYHGKPATMKLSQMQDIAGCRAIMSDVSLARKLFEKHYLKGDLKHKRVGIKNYIDNPKDDGYRSIHAIYKFFSDKGKKEYNGLLVEIQIRSKLQHLWATAIETVDFFTRQAIKSNEGQEEWMDFFKLLSSAFAGIEKCPIVPNTPTNKKELYSMIKEKERELNVIAKMKGWAEGIRVFEEASKSSVNLQYFLLELDVRAIEQNRSQINVTAYTKDSEQLAIADYLLSEKQNLGKKEHDVVLVGADNVSELKKAYPNYFVDSTEFLIVLEKILKKY